MIRVWRAGPDDLEHCYQCAVECYGDLVKDPAQVRAWLAEFLPGGDAEVVILRTENGAAVFGLQQVFYDPTPEVHMLFLCVLKRARRGLSSEGYALLKSVVDWARNLGASFYFGSNTGTDLTPLARRLGAVQEPPAFKMELGSRGEKA